MIKKRFELLKRIMSKITKVIKKIFLSLFLVRFDSLCFLFFVTQILTSSDTFLYFVPV